MLLQREIDLVLTDMMMPNMDGAALTDAITRIEPDVRIVVASGLPAHALEFTTSRANVHFLAKLFTSDTQLSAIRRRLDDMQPAS